MVLNPTRGNNILDLVLSTAPDLLFDLSVNEGLIIALIIVPLNLI